MRQRTLRGASGLWRLPLGDWRVVYTVEAERVVVVLVLMIDGRGDVYERLKRRLG